MFDSVRKLVKTKIESTTGLPVYFVEAKEDVNYPYITFDLSEIYSDMIGKHRYTLTVDVWSKLDVKVCTNAVKKLDKEWKQAKEKVNEGVICIYHGSSAGFTEDEDRTIKHFVRTYDIMTFEK